MMTRSRYLNGRRRGRAVTPGMRIWTEDEEELVAVAPLRPPLRWAVSVGYCYTVEVSACAPPRPAAVDADATAAAAARAIDEKQEREWREACAESSGSEEWLTPACA
jgi:hypothetical protein